MRDKFGNETMPFELWNAAREEGVRMADQLAPLPKTDAATVTVVSFFCGFLGTYGLLNLFDVLGFIHERRGGNDYQGPALIVAILAGGGAYLYMRSRERAHSTVASEVLEAREARWRREREAELAED